MPEAKRKRFLFYKEAIHPILKRTQANRALDPPIGGDDKPAREIVNNGTGIP